MSRWMSFFGPASSESSSDLFGLDLKREARASFDLFVVDLKREARASSDLFVLDLIKAWSESVVRWWGSVVLFLQFSKFLRFLHL